MTRSTRPTRPKAVANLHTSPARDLSSAIDGARNIRRVRCWKSPMPKVRRSTQLPLDRRVHGPAGHRTSRMLSGLQREDGIESLFGLCTRDAPPQRCPGRAANQDQPSFRAASRRLCPPDRRPRRLPS